MELIQLFSPYVASIFTVWETSYFNVRPRLLSGKYFLTVFVNNKKLLQKITFFIFNAVLWGRMTLWRTPCWSRNVQFFC